MTTTDDPGEKRIKHILLQLATPQERLSGMTALLAIVVQPRLRKSLLYRTRIGSSLKRTYDIWKREQKPDMLFSTALVYVILYFSLDKILAFTVLREGLVSVLIDLCHLDDRGAIQELNSAFSPRALQGLVELQHHCIPNLLDFEILVDGANPHYATLAQDLVRKGQARYILPLGIEGLTQLMRFRVSTTDVEMYPLSKEEQMIEHKRALAHYNAAMPKDDTSPASVFQFHQHSLLHQKRAIQRWKRAQRQLRHAAFIQMATSVRFVRHLAVRSLFSVVLRLKSHTERDLFETSGGIEALLLLAGMPSPRVVQPHFSALSSTVRTAWHSMNELTPVVSQFAFATLSSKFYREALPPTLQRRMNDYSNTSKCQDFETLVGQQRWSAKACEVLQDMVESMAMYATQRQVYLESISARPDESTTTTTDTPREKSNSVVDRLEAFTSSLNKSPKKKKTNPTVAQWHEQVSSVRRHIQTVLRDTKTIQTFLRETTCLVERGLARDGIPYCDWLASLPTIEQRQARVTRKREFARARALELETKRLEQEHETQEALALAEEDTRRLETEQDRRLRQQGVRDQDRRAEEVARDNLARARVELQQAKIAQDRALVLMKKEDTLEVEKRNRRRLRLTELDQETLRIQAERIYQVRHEREAKDRRAREIQKCCIEDTLGRRRRDLEFETERQARACATKERFEMHRAELECIQTWRALDHEAEVQARQARQMHARQVRAWNRKKLKLETRVAEIESKWLRVYDEEEKTEVYVHSSTGETAYEMPVSSERQELNALLYEEEGGEASEEPVAQSWTRREDEKGQVYYENTETGETMWDVPTTSSSSSSDSVVCDWIDCHDAEGNVYYQDTTTGEVVWDIPETVPDAALWTLRKDDNGSSASYYYNLRTGVCTWDRPSFGNVW